MRYHDLLIHSGRVGKRYEHNTDDLGPEALGLFRSMLNQLRKGETEVVTGTPGMPDLALALGLPETLASFDVPGRFFGIGRPGTIPFSINLILPAAPDRSARESFNDAYEAGDRDAYALATLMSLSLAATEAPDQAQLLDTEMDTVWTLRCGRRAAPVLLTLLMPRTDGEVILSALAADASTLVAASILLEGQ